MARQHSCMTRCKKYDIYFLLIKIMEQQAEIIEANTIPPKTETISSSMESPEPLELQELVAEDRSKTSIKTSRFEDLLFKSDEQQDSSLNVKTQTNLSTSPQWVLSKESSAEKQLSTIIAALEKAGLDDDYIMWVIKEGIESAVFQGPKGAMLRDRPSIIKLVDKYLKLKKYYKSDTVINVLNAFANPWQLY